MRLKKRIYLICFTAFLCVTINFCFSANSQDTIFIALSKASGSENYERYAKWLCSFDSRINCVDLINKTPNEAALMLEKCSGLVLTGGPDVNPAFYGKPKEYKRCELDKKRDTLEFALINKAIQLKLPILAICRGEQIINVAMGGSLIVDIPTDKKTFVKVFTSWLGRLFTNFKDITAYTIKKDWSTPEPNNTTKND